MVYTTTQPELMGIFGTSWQEIIASNMGYPVTFLNSLQYGNIVNTIYKRYKEYLKKGYQPYDKALIPILASETGQTTAKIESFLDEIRKKDTTGKALLVKPEGVALKLPGVNTILLPLAVVAGIFLYMSTRNRGVFNGT
jgi:hypothetical protein